MSGNIEITNDNPLIAKALSAALSARKLSAKTVDSFSPAAAIGIITTGLRQSGASDIHWDSLCKARDFRAAGGARLFLLNNGLFKEKSDSLSGWDGGLSGLAKTAAREWDDISVHTVDVSLPREPMTQSAASKLAKHIVSALLTALPEVQIQPDGSLYTLELGQRMVPSATMTSTEKNVWLVTGGARGVTSSCIIDLAARAGGSFILLGRSEISPWPIGIEPTTDIKALRNAFVQQMRASGTRPDLQTINSLAKAALAGAEIRATLNAIEASGATAAYYACDITDADKTGRVLDQVTQSYGTITALVHGAGVLADRFIMDISKAEVERVFTTKVTGLQTILAKTNPQDLRRVALFSSAAARYGNVGQSAYAMANEVLNKVAHSLFANMNQGVVKSFNWGPWAGGMVDETLAKHFKDQNIGLIPLQTGAQIFSDQMLYGDRDAVEVLIGDAWSAK